MTTKLSTKKALDVDPKMILEVAAGIRHPADIAADYGYSETEWFALQEFEPFVKAVENKKAELRASGYTFRMKAAVAAEDLLEDVYAKAKDPDSSFHTQLETLKFMARAAGLEAPVRAEQTNTPAFSITINLGNGTSVNIGGANQESRPPEEEFDSVVSFDSFDPLLLPK